MLYVYVSDFDMRGGGYKEIGVATCTRLVERGAQVVALGLQYKGDEHDCPFPIIPTNVTLAQVMIHNLLLVYKKIDALIVALDIPLHEAFLAQPYRKDVKYVGIFPVEGDPICMDWAALLWQMDVRLIISEFGRMEAEKVGIPAAHYPVALEPALWPYPEEGLRAKIREGLGIAPDEFVVLTVGANQERKFLSRAMEAVADLVYGKQVPDPVPHGLPVARNNVRYWMVTDLESRVGWKLSDFALRLGLRDRMAFWQYGLPQDKLRALMIAADCMLLTSKAEGCCLPILEAMSCGTIVAATHCTAITEHLSEDRGVFIEPDYVMVDPWGNSRRYLAGREATASALTRIYEMSELEKNTMRLRARQYVDSRDWNASVDILEKAIVGGEE